MFERWSGNLRRYCRLSIWSRECVPTLAWSEDYERDRLLLPLVRFAVSCNSVCPVMEAAVVFPVLSLPSIDFDLWSLLSPSWDGGWVCGAASALLLGHQSARTGRHSWFRIQHSDGCDTSCVERTLDTPSSCFLPTREALAWQVVRYILRLARLGED